MGKKVAERVTPAATPSYAVAVCLGVQKGPAVSDW